LIGGVSQIVSGGLLDATAGLSGQWLFVPIDPFTPWFIMGILLTGVSIILFRRVQSQSEYSVSEFVSLFTHGNPVSAFGSLIRYYRARDERATVVVTERMGQTKSPLTVDELLEALHDPRFNVRFEAVISIARMGSDPRLVEALGQLVNGTEISLSVIAAWALGRMGDEAALPTLRAGLNSHYRSLQAACGRALGTLGDTQVAPLLLERLQTETDKGLQIAYSSALGRMQWKEALPTLFDVLEATENEGARMEVALAIARALDDEQHFIGLVRHMRQDSGTSAAQEIIAWRRRHERALHPEALAHIEACADLFARDQMHEGARSLSDTLRQFMPDVNETARLILQKCAACLEKFGGSRPEYLVLALHALQTAD
jgi:HEAT repeat protein